MDVLAAIDAFGAATTIRIPALELFADSLAAALSQGPTVMRFILSLFLAYPLAAANYALPVEWARHVLSAAGGVILSQFIFGQAWIRIALVAFLSYFALACPDFGVKAIRHWRHVASAVLTFGFLTYAHLTRNGASASSIDVTAALMVLTCKLYAFAYNVYDGTVDEHRLRAAVASPSASLSEKRMYVDRLARAMPSLPSPLLFAGYAFNFSTMFVGPAFEIREYATAQARFATPPGAPSRIASAMRKLALGSLLLLAFVLLSGHFPIEDVYHQAVAANNGTGHLPLWHRLYFAWIALLTLRIQYYGCWKIAEGSAVLAGYGYRPEADQAALEAAAEHAHGAPLEGSAALPKKGGDWEGVSNVNPLAVESSVSTIHIIRDWNVHTQSWLERYIYRRSPRGISRFLTFFASAFWHGFYPGYYLSFLMLPFAQEILRYMARTWHGALVRFGGFDKRAPEERAFVLFRWFCTIGILNYFFIPFVLLDRTRGIEVWRSLSYIGHVLLVAAWLFTLVLAPILKSYFPEAHHKRHHSGASAGRAAPASRSGTSEAGSATTNGQANGHATKAE